VKLACGRTKNRKDLSEERLKVLIFLDIVCIPAADCGPRKTVSIASGHARRLYEQGASVTRLRQYVLRWWRWFWGGLEGLVCAKGGMKRYWVHIRIHLDIHGKMAD
jgi:hypothetical protein